MIPDPMTTPALAPTAIRMPNRFRRIAAVQGVYFLLTGLWPLFAFDSFQAVTGPKADLWLVYTVGGLVAAIGLTLIFSVVSRRMTPEITILAVGSAFALAAVDVVFVYRGVLSGIYVLDAMIEAGLIAWWIVTHIGVRPSTSTVVSEYPHVQALLARGQSVPPNGRR